MIKKIITSLIIISIINIALADGTNQSIVQQIVNTSGIPYTGSGTWSWVVANIEGRFYNPLVQYLKTVFPANPSMDLFSTMGLPIWLGMLVAFILMRTLEGKVEIIFWVYTVIMIIWFILAWVAQGSINTNMILNPLNNTITQNLTRGLPQYKG